DDRRSAAPSRDSRRRRAGRRSAGVDEKEKLTLSPELSIGRIFRVNMLSEYQWYRSVESSRLYPACVIYARVMKRPRAIRSWAAEEFGTANLGDIRRAERLVKMAEQAAVAPAG